MNGLHFTADLSGCASDVPLMTDVDLLKHTCVSLVQSVGLTVVGECFHGFPAMRPGQAGGVTGVVLLAESHLAVHTWPESGVVTLDVFVCNVHTDNRAAAQQVLDQLSQAFAPANTSRHQLLRRVDSICSLARTPAVNASSKTE